MPDYKLLLLAKDLRARAEEVLAQVESMKDANAREEMRGIAADYERLADRLERHARDANKV